MSKPLCLVQAPIATRSGYGEHARDIVRSLIAMDKFDIAIIGTRWGDTPYINLDTPRDREIFKRVLQQPILPRQPELFIHITVPNEFQPIGKYNIGITAGIETTACSHQWLEGMNRMQLVIVPSRHSKNVFQSTTYNKTNDGKNVVGELKCTVPVDVLFEGVDTGIYRFDENVPSSLRHKLKSIPESFTFLFVGHWLNGDIFQDRKDVGGLIKVFLETFKDMPNAPALMLKTSLGTLSIMDRDEIFRRIATVKSIVKYDKTLPNIYLVHGDLTDDEMNGLYNHPKVKAHVSFTKGEGFGRPLLEASMSRKPVLAPNWSGQIDFLHPDGAVLLPGALNRIHASAVWDGVLIEGSSWYSVNYTVASQVLMDVWKNYQKYKTRANNQALVSEKKFSLKNMESELAEILERRLPKFEVPDEVKIVMPDISNIKLPVLKPMAPVTSAETLDSIDASAVQPQEQKGEHETQTATIGGQNAI